jgi:FMN phosphatase YigB (HAD superfamily)
VPAPIDAVTFDFWNTLVYEEHGQLRGIRLQSWTAILEDAGIHVPPDRLEQAFDASWAEYERAWFDNRQYLHDEAVADIVRAIGVTPTDEVVTALAESFPGAADGADLHLADGIEECLLVLRSAGLRIGIVCDVGMTPSSSLIKLLDSRGVLSSFDHWSFSDVVGVYKPDPAIFLHALAGLGSPEPDRVAHVGDRTRTDVAGALGMGMIAVRYTGVYDDGDDGPPATHVVGRHSDLARVLGVV